MPILTEVVSTPSETGDPVDKGSTDFAALRQKIFGGPKKSPKVKSLKNSANDADATQKDLDELFAGENWEAISSMYFDARFAITGFDGFLLDPAQKKTLGITLGKSMKMLLKIDPGYIALTVFVTTFGGLIAQKEMTYKAIKKEMEERGPGKVS